MPQHLNIGAIIYPGLDQIDFTGPFEVLVRVPDSTFLVLGKDTTPVRDYRGLLLTPERALADAPALDVLVVPGGPGQEALMHDEVVLEFLRTQAAGAQVVLSVCTGALLLGAAGLLMGKRATTHWASFHLLEHFGATPVDERVVIDGRLVTAAGVTAGIDAALHVTAMLRGQRVAQEIQLAIEYAPEPPFTSGTPKTAPAEVHHAVRERTAELTAQRLETARRVAERLQINHREHGGHREDN